jgi:hypothetical protein
MQPYTHANDRYFPPNFLLLHLGATRSIPTVAEAKTPSHSLGDRSDLKSQARRSSNVTELGVYQHSCIRGSIIHSLAFKSRSFADVHPVFEV